MSTPISKRKNVLCVLCKTNENLSFHHIFPYYKSKTRNKKVAICKEQHRKIHYYFSNKELIELADKGIYPSKLKFLIELNKKISQEKEASSE
ncbi:MAG TPA: hypothetical protein VMX17_06005 [Candidatus Glassbacteria bacterium]|nr:hypothetical protein [Candidatus Glassbacteria bacterium]